MCMGGGGSAPAVPAPIAPPKDPPKHADPAVKKAREDDKRAAALALGRDGTILNGAGGLTDPATTAKKVVLGG